MDDQIRMAIIYGSTRPGRFCDTVVNWVIAEMAEAVGRGVFVVDLIDPADSIAALAPRIGATDAFIVVTPEYNHGYPAPLKALIDSVHAEWRAKPVSFVSYGGVSGGLRAVEQLRQVFAELHAVTLRDCVSFANAWDRFDAAGNLIDANQARKSLAVLLAQLRWWAVALRAARQTAPYEQIA